MVGWNDLPLEPRAIVRESNRTPPFLYTLNVLQKSRGCRSAQRNNDVSLAFSNFDKCLGSVFPPEVGEASFLLPQDPVTVSPLPHLRPALVLVYLHREGVHDVELSSQQTRIVTQLIEHCPALPNQRTAETHLVYGRSLP